MMSKFNKIRKIIRQNFILLYFLNFAIMLVVYLTVLPLLDKIPAFSTPVKSPYSSLVSTVGLLNVVMLLTIVFWDRSGDCKCNKKHDNETED